MRLVKANALDLTLFQFDYDLTFAVIFMNADKTIYGRYGSRSSVEEATRDMSMAGLADAMSAALAIHAEYPGNRTSLAGKQPAATQYKTPDDFPSLRGQFKDLLDYEGAVSRSCLHCHQVRDAERQVYRDAGEPIPDELLFPNPLPSTVGLDFDPRHRGTTTSVAPRSPADVAGFEAGDALLSLDGQPIISLADTQWVLHHADAPGTIEAVVNRNGERIKLQLKLSESWRRQSDISWRVSSWPLRRMGTGGLRLEAATGRQRRDARIDDDRLALVVDHVGQYGAHAVAKRAGFQKGDLIVSFDGQSQDMTTSQLLGYAVQNTKPGQQVDVDVIRDGRRLTLRLPMQK